MDYSRRQPVSLQEHLFHIDGRTLANCVEIMIDPSVGDLAAASTPSRSSFSSQSSTPHVWAPPLFRARLTRLLCTTASSVSRPTAVHGQRRAGHRRAVVRAQENRKRSELGNLD